MWGVFLCLGPEGSNGLSAKARLLWAGSRGNRRCPPVPRCLSVSWSLPVRMHTDTHISPRLYYKETSPLISLLNNLKYLSRVLGEALRRSKAMQPWKCVCLVGQVESAYNEREENTQEMAFLHTQAHTHANLHSLR